MSKKQLLSDDLIVNLQKGILAKKTGVGVKRDSVAQIDQNHFGDHSQTGFVKIGAHLVTVEIVEQIGSKWKVRNNKTGKEWVTGTVIFDKKEVKKEQNIQKRKSSEGISGMEQNGEPEENKTANNVDELFARVTSKGRIFSRSEISIELLQKLIKAQRSFEITGLEAEGSMTKMIDLLEKVIESNHLRCRVYTVGRGAAIAAAAVPTGITQITGGLAALGIGLHNLATYNPDYAIGKHLLDNKLSVTKKEVEIDHETGKRATGWGFMKTLVKAVGQGLDEAMVDTAKKGFKAQGREQEFKDWKAKHDETIRQLKDSFTPKKKSKESDNK